MAMKPIFDANTRKTNKITKLPKPTLPESTQPTRKTVAPDWLPDFERAMTLSMERAGQLDPISAESLAAMRQRTEQAIAAAAKKTPQALAEAVKRNNPVASYMAQEAKRAEQRNKDLFPPPVAPISPSAERSLYNEETASLGNKYAAEQEEELERANMEQYSKYIRRITADELEYDERLRSDYYNTRRAQEQAGQNFNDNFKTFQEANIQKNEHITDQTASKISEMHFGVSNVADSGCGAIAVYNVLCDLDASISPPTVIYAAESSGLMELGGRFGIMPRNIPRLLDYFGVKNQRVRVAAAQRDAQNQTLQPGQKYIACILNDAKKLQEGIHTFEVVYDPTYPDGPWVTYNWSYKGSAVPLNSLYKALISRGEDGSFTYGRFLALYRIEE